MSRLVLGPSDLKQIRVLYRKDDSLTLYGIPYEMKPGQAPKDILERYRGAWFYLGEPGWYGNMTTWQMKTVRDFVDRLEAQGLVPNGPHEWLTLPNESGVLASA